MTDRPIIFSAPMVRALLEGRKTQTRRVLKPQPNYREDVPTKLVWQVKKNKGIFNFDDDQFRRHAPLLSPYAPGDRLYVREAHKLIDRHCDYRADWPEENQRLFKWRPSIHMPRWASRLTLTVTDVRVQRLQDISEADAWAEGCKKGDPWDSGNGHFPVEEPSPDGKGWNGWDNARDWYADLWESLHGANAWDANPWCVAVSFTVQHGNIDQLGGRNE